MTKQQALQVNTTAMAYLGDALYEVKIREYVLAQVPSDVNQAHRIAVKYVSANGQAKAAKTMLAASFLTDDEERLLKRARNHRTMSKPSNADPKNYKIATGFEALIGYLHLIGDEARLQEIVDEAVRIIEE